MLLRPEQAVAAMRRRGIITPTASWMDLWHEEHDTQFTVSRLARKDLLEKIRSSIESVIADDITRVDYFDIVRRALEEAGWLGRIESIDPRTGETVASTFDASRLRLILDTNLSTAYAAGKWERIQQTVKTHPYLRYVTLDDDKVRDEHAQWHNLTLPVGHPFWQTHFPPNGYRCRCRAVAISQDDYDTGLSPKGDKLIKEAPEEKMELFVNTRTGERSLVPQGVTPGFDRAPGASRRLPE